MFGFVQNNKVVVQIVLGIVSLGLAVSFGLSGYGSFQQDKDFLVKVGDTTITDRDLADELGQRTIPDEAKPFFLEQLVSQRLMLEEAQHLRLAISEDQLRKVISTIPAFQVNGEFNKERYKELLSAQQMTPEAFERKVRQKLVLNQSVGSLIETGFVARVFQDQFAQLIGEKREVQAFRILLDSHLKEVTVTDVEVKQYYDTHQADFKLPERVKLDYLLLSRNKLVASQEVSDAELQKYFDEHKTDLAKEERRASHILLTVPRQATPEQKIEVKKQAEALLAELKADPSQFAQLAKQKSKDPGSAANGGDLGWFPEGVMVKPFNDAIFKMSKGQISEIVETDFGFHIIRLDDIRTKTLADVKLQVEQAVKIQKAQSLFQDLSSKLSELVYQHPESLQPAADALHLSIYHSGWVTRQSASDPVLNNSKLLAAIFSEDIVKNKHNTEAIEMSPGVFVSARVAEHIPESIQPLSAVAADIEKKLLNEKARKRALDEGIARLKGLQQTGDESGISWEPAITEVQRLGHYPSPLNQFIEAIFQVSPDSKLPVYVGGESGEGYVIYRINKITPPSELDKNQLSGRIAVMVNQLNGRSTAEAYLNTLKKEIKVEYKKQQAASQ